MLCSKLSFLTQDYGYFMVMNAKSLIIGGYKISFDF